MTSMSIIYAFYFTLGIIFSTMLYLSISRYFSTRKSIMRSLYTVLLTSVLLTRAIPVALSTSLKKELVLIGSDQAFDYASTKYIVATGHIELNITAPRIAEYLYYPAIHLTGAMLSLITNCNICVVCVMPMIELLIISLALRRLFKSSIRLIILFPILATNGYFSIFHTQYIREVYSFTLFGILLLLTTKTAVMCKVKVLSDQIVALILLVSLAFSHYYTRYTFILLLYLILIIFTLNSGLRKLSLKHLNKTIAVGTLTSMLYDLYMSIAYTLKLKPEDWLKNILDTYRRLITADFVSSAVEVSEKVGTILPEYERLGIFLNQLVPLFLFAIYVIHNLSSKNRRTKLFITITMLLFCYYGFLLLKLSQNLYVVNLGLRASQYVLLLLLIAITIDLECLCLNFSKSNIMEKRRVMRSKLVLSMLIFIVFLSTITYPSLLSPPFKGLAPSYYVSYNIAKSLNALLPLYANRICTLVREPGNPVNDLFNGFVCGFLPEKSNVIVSLIHDIHEIHNSKDISCDVIYVAGDFDISQKAYRILDARTFALYIA